MIRVATESDAAALLDIYAPFVRDTAVSFEWEPPAEAVFRQRILQTLENYPWLVLESDGAVTGYAYAGAYHQRAGWKWSASSSVYIHPHYHRRGAGRTLYQCLFDLLRMQGYYNVYAGATLPNAGSVALHEATGFMPLGICKSGGFKLGKWHDVIQWQLNLQPYAASPVSPVAFPDLSKTQLNEVFSRYKGIA